MSRIVVDPRRHRGPAPLAEPMSMSTGISRYRDVRTCDRALNQPRLPAFQSGHWHLENARTNSG